MRIERTATSISWIPSASIPGLLRLPFERGVMHYDAPPPLTLTDLDGMRRRGGFRFANRVEAWIEVSNGLVSDCGYGDGGTIMGLTPVSVGPLRVLLPTKRHPEIRRAPFVAGREVTFVQTAGGRPGFSFLKPSLRWPFLVTRPFTIWTTIELTIRADGTAVQRLVGASPFPRHWLYDDAGHLVEKAALTRNKTWVKTAFGSHTPWGGEDETPVVAAAESELERTLADEIMRGDSHPAIRTLASGQTLFREAEAATTVALILDGNLEVRVHDKAVGTIGPGAVVGERAALEAGLRTAEVRAVTEARVGEVPVESLSADLLRELALGHHREDT